jgi:hydrogenase expression/formation protein HypE
MKTRTRSKKLKPVSRKLQRQQITLAHGGGGQLTDELLRKLILPQFENPSLNDLLDSGIVSNEQSQLALTIDSYVVQPLKFPGGDIGRLCISGTVNDLAVCGAVPLGIALSFILAEGLEQSVLEEVSQSIANTAREAGVCVVTGDTKTVAHHQADQMYITTAGIGTLRRDCVLHPRRVKPGDVLIVNGPIADHGLAVMLAREMPEMHSALRSDVVPLNGLIQTLLDRVPNIVFMRDATRGGLAAVAADLASRTRFHIVLFESGIPVRSETRHAAELLGIDPLDVANEGKVVVVVREQEAEIALNTLREHPLGREACIIGKVDAKFDGICELRTLIGGRRIVQKPYGEQLPRIC